MIRMQAVHRIPYEPTPDNIRRELARLNITAVEAAELMRVDPRTFRRYLQERGTEGSTPMPFGSFALLRLTKRNDK